ncbi:DgyrCDS10504 [Dimorphilus gyrociliatus]|uniref:DgyrCDS10504 n=1 Tax=Dimorphilus gyrociliatus TaxID=2664684 RepID=A0A7I8W2Z1_9ANNE|nr:DgyrCDS10504 [Dimorphilus gyrociliatus]
MVEGAKRDTWGGKAEFLLSCIGYAVGLGTIWRFPYVCYQGGGAAFLIPYTIYLLLFGIPLIMLEMGLGQFSNKGPIGVWEISPLFKGVGYAMCIICGITSVYYNVIISWTLYFFTQSFRSPLPWSNCNNTWNNPETCRVVFSRNSTDNFTISKTCEVNQTIIQTPSEQFWERNVLQLSSGIENLGGLKKTWHLFLANAVAWILVFLCLIKGIKSSGKVVYITVTFPYIVLITFFIRAVTLDGASDGLWFYFVPKWSKLLDFEPWSKAAMQLFYSMGAAWGSLITFSSYNKYKNNFYRDAIIVGLTDTLTAIFAGMVIFCIIGFMSKQTGLDIEDVVVQGPGLVFVVYPEAITQFPGPKNFWAVLFFIFLFTVGIDSQFGMIETMMTTLVDELPKKASKAKIFLTMFVCFVGLILGIPCVTQGGMYFLHIMDWYASTFSLMIISFIECVVIAWIYGVNKFRSDTASMLGHNLSMYWIFSWKFISPALILFVFISAVVKHKSVTYGCYVYPGWAVSIGWMFALCSILVIPAVAVYSILCHAKGTFVQRVKMLLRPTDNWKPAIDEEQEPHEHQKLSESAFNNSDSGEVTNSKA